MHNKIDFLLGDLFRKEMIEINEMRELMDYNSKILKEKEYTKEEIIKIIDEERNNLFQDLYETGNKLRELLLSDMTEDEIGKLINNSIKEYREEESRNGQ